MTHFSDVERRILINQLQILTAIDPKQAHAYERSIRRMTSATNIDGGPEPVRQIAMAEVDEPMTFTFRILSFYSFLQDSFYALDLKEKLRIDHTALVFPGFHEPSEQLYADHVSFIRYNLGQFTLLETRDDEPPQGPMLPFYRELLALKTDRNDVLDHAGITDMIDTINKLHEELSRRGDADLKTASAA